MKEIRQKLMVLNIYLSDISSLVRKRFGKDLDQYDMSGRAGTTRLDVLGHIGELVEKMKVDAKDLDTSVGIVEDMEKGLEAKGE